MFEIFHGRPGRESLIAHYLNVDPHQAVAASRSGFYRFALKELNSIVKQDPRVLLDVGCGFGHFMEMAAAGGWRVMGVDLLAEGVRASRQRVPSAAVFEGDLLEARFDPCSLHAVTMWDVLDQLEDPGAALEKCLSILAPGGVIAIRVRNGPCQLGIYRLHRGLRRLWDRLGIRPLFVFHRFSFTHRAIERLLQNRGFEILSIRNSPLTRGEPYQIRSMKGILQVGKTGVGVISDALFRLSAGRAIAGPSLLAWARKPRFGEFPGFQRI